MTDTTFTLSEEQELLRKTARRFLDERSPTDTVREHMASEAGFDESLWGEMAQMGWAGLAVPEAHGGAGYGFVELSVLLEEMGRSLVCAPFLSTAVLAVAALEESGTDEQRGRLLPAIASGERRVTVALGHGASPVGATLDARRDGDGWVLSGTLDHVLDGHTADELIVPAVVDGATALFVVAGDAQGLATEPLETLDQTRALARIRCDDMSVDATARLDGDGAAILARVRTVASVAMACEQVGGARRVLEMSTAYAKDRKQFGRAIGSFQAIKHTLAEMLVAVESARSAAYYAARVLAADDREELAIAAPLAASYCAEVYEQAAGDAIQIHGGIGFTWEHDAHLYFKRAKSSSLMFGAPVVHRRALADVLGL